MTFDILNHSYSEFVEFVVNDLKEPRFRAEQVWQWIWQKNEFDFAKMSNLSLKARSLLAEKAVISLPQIVEEQVSVDGTRKFLLRLSDGAMIETVLIPGEKRSGHVRITQCVSCQVGCAMGCTFCHTAQMGFIRNMTVGEILGQVLVAKQVLGDNEAQRPILRNIVFMGMGEPLLNFDALMQSLHILHEEKGANFSARRITVSSCGIPRLHELGKSNLAYLALSLHAPNQALREKIMPKAAKYPLDKLLADLQSYPLKTREHLTLEYLMLGGVNDGVEHAKELAKIVQKIDAKLNLIAYNGGEGSKYRAPSYDKILEFQRVLWDKDIVAILRKSKGQDISAACGQLYSENKKKELDKDM